jgi:ribonuclease P protein component
MELRRHGQRAGSGTLTVVARPDTGTELPEVAFAISKKVGNAPQRNLVRRRLRHLLAETRRAEPSALPPGHYLVIGRPGSAERSYASLEADLRGALARSLAGARR